MLAWLRGIALAEIPAYFARGFSALAGFGTAPHAAMAPVLAVGYIACNLLFNVTALMGLRAFGNVVLGLLVAVLVPLTIWVFTFDLFLLVSQGGRGLNSGYGTGVWRQGKRVCYPMCCFVGRVGASGVW